MTNRPLRITVFAPRYAVTAGSGQVQPEQPWEMHPTDVMDVAGDHTRAVGGNDAAQIGHRQIRPMFGQQPGRACADPCYGVTPTSVSRRPDVVRPPGATHEIAAEAQ